MSSGSTGGTEGSSPASSPASGTSQTMLPVSKFGTLVPNRIFVGGISAGTSEDELAQLFSNYGNVKATKIISDRAGISKGYGFVTFETEEEAKRLQQESECIVLKERKLNIAPAIKKQPFNRSFDGGSGSPPAVPTSPYFYTNGMGIPYQNGMFYNTGAPAPGTTLAPPTDPTAIYQAASVFGPQAASAHQTFAPVMYPCPAPSIYMHQQYPYSTMPYDSYFGGAPGAHQFLYPVNNSTNSSSNGAANGGNNNSSNNSNNSSNNGRLNNTGMNGPPGGLTSIQAHHYYPGLGQNPQTNQLPNGTGHQTVDHHLYYNFSGVHQTTQHDQHQQQQTQSSQQQIFCQDNQQSNDQSNQEEYSSSSYHHHHLHHHHHHQIDNQENTVPTSSIPKYSNYYSYPLTIQPSPIPNSQLESEDTNQMQCRAIIYHPVYIQNQNLLPIANKNLQTMHQNVFVKNRTQQYINSSHHYNNNYNSNTINRKNSLNIHKLNSGSNSPNCNKNINSGQSNNNNNNNSYIINNNNSINKKNTLIIKDKNHNSEIISGNSPSYSPLSNPNPNNSPPNVQVQFYTTPTTRCQPRRYGNINNQIGMRKIPSAVDIQKQQQHHQHQHQQHQQSVMIRSSKFKVNSLNLNNNTGKVIDDNIVGSSGDQQTVSRIPLTNSPNNNNNNNNRNNNNLQDSNQINDACHQIQALKL